MPVNDRFILIDTCPSTLSVLVPKRTFVSRERLEKLRARRRKLVTSGLRTPVKRKKGSPVKKKGLAGKVKTDLLSPAAQATLAGLPDDLRRKLLGG